MKRAVLAISALLLILTISGTEAAVYNLAPYINSSAAGMLVLLGTGLVCLASWGRKKYRK